MVAKLTHKEFVKWLNQSVGKQYNFDNWYGFQCFDSANAGWSQLYPGERLKGYSAKNIPTENNFSGKATVYNNTESFLAKPGDMVVFNGSYGGGHGHVAWVLEATLDYIIVAEQNWLGQGWTDGIESPGWGPEKVTKRKHGYDFPMWFVRPEFKPENPSKVKPEAAKKPAKKTTKKAKKLNYIREEVTGYKLPNRGYKPKGVVLHNDAGSAGATAKAYRNGLVNAPLSRLEAGIAHSYISGNDVWQALPESRVAWHTANQTGNKDYYGIEICQSVGASNKEFLSNEQAVFQETARLLKKWGLPANRNTVRLHVEFSNTACPHRSAELHTGWNPTTQGLLPKAQQTKLKDYFIKQIRAYMDNKVPTSTVSKDSPASSNTVKPIAGKWRRNSYGTYYMSESATFTNGNQPIQVRTVGPFLSCPKAYMFQPGGYTSYDEVMIQDGFVWIGYTWKGVRYYLPIRTAKGTPPNHSTGPLWGSIS